jgi:hypothetical protein
MFVKIVIRKKQIIFRENIMSSIEQLETLRNAELYDDCKILVFH